MLQNISSLHPFWVHTKCSWKEKSWRLIVSSGHVVNKSLSCGGVMWNYSKNSPRRNSRVKFQRVTLLFGRTDVKERRESWDAACVTGVAGIPLWTQGHLTSDWVCGWVGARVGEMWSAGRPDVAALTFSLIRIATNRFTVDSVSPSLLPAENSTIC